MLSTFSFISLIIQLIVFIDKKWANRCFVYNTSSRLNGLACLRMFICKIFILSMRDIVQSQPKSRQGGLTCFSCELILILKEFYSGDEILAKPASSPPYEQPLIQS